MKLKLVALLVIVISLTQVTQSQVLIGLLFGDKLNKGPIEFGLNGIVNQSSTSLNNGATPRTVIGFGLYLDYNFNPKLSLSTSFFFASPKGEKNFNTNDPMYMLTDSLFTGAQTERVLNYFELPIMFQFRPAPWIGIGFGGYASLLTKAYDYYKASTNDGDILHERSILDQMNRFDYGIMGGLHYHFKGDPGAQIRISYMLGMHDLFKNAAVNGQNQNVQIGFLIPIKFGVNSEKSENIKE